MVTVTTASGQGEATMADGPVNQPIAAREARALILSGRAPDGLCVAGHLDLSGSDSLVELPADLSALSLDLANCHGLRALPDGLRVRRLNLSGCTALRNLPAELALYELGLRDTNVTALPADLRVEYRLDLTGCAALASLPPGLTVGSLVLRGCTRLRALPEGLNVYFLDISGCVNLAAWPETASLRIGHLNAGGCGALQSLPRGLTGLAQLDVSDCAHLRALPEGLTVASWVDLAGSAVRALPASLRGVRLRWRGVLVDERVVFQPETITVDEVLGERNVEVRRVMMECMGYDRFLAEARATVLDQDRDPGGARRLLRVPIPRDEDLVCLAVTCPSTGRDYMLRVPPTMRSCRQAAAWIAGFDDADAFAPLAET